MTTTRKPNITTLHQPTSTQVNYDSKRLHFSKQLMTEIIVIPFTVSASHNLLMSYPITLIIEEKHNETHIRGFVIASLIQFIDT